MSARQSSPGTAGPQPSAPNTSAPDALRVAEHLAALVRIPTVTPREQDSLAPDEVEVFSTFRAALETFYPRTFAAAEVETVGRAGLMFRIQGRQEGIGPMVLMAHQDVVPVPEDWQAEGWEHPPFAGVVAGGFVHGRGTLDDKGSLVVMLEAVESLLGEGWSPESDVYLLMGADEESYGGCAIAATSLLESRGLEPWLVLDEGGAIATGAFPGVERELAIVGVSEKGLATVELAAQSTGGHASTPPRQSAAGIIAKAITRLESRPFPSRLNDVSVEMFQAIAPHASGALGAAMRLAKPLRPMLARLLPRLGPEIAALVRTTTAVTQLSGSPAHNVLATRATAIVNLRIAVGSSVAESVARVKATVADARVSVRLIQGSEPSPVSPRGSTPGWLAIGDAVAAAYPDAVTVPYVMLAASDARHVARIAPFTYRFSPLRMDKAQRTAVHGPNEKVEVESLGRAVTFYRRLLTANADRG